MKIKSNYIPGAHFVEVEPCTKSRKQFDKQACALRKFLRNSNPPLASSLTPEVREMWIAGLDAIERLAYIPSKIIYVEPMAAAHAMNVVTSCILASENEEAKAQLVVLFALASMTPVTLPDMDLPDFPAAWATSHASEDAMELYERVRDTPVVPILRLTQAYFLFIELAGKSHLEPSVQQLVAHLEGVTTILRVALKHTIG